MRRRLDDCPERSVHPRTLAVRGDDSDMSRRGHARSGQRPRIVSPGREARRTTCSATLPIRKRRTPPRPCVPMTMRSGRQPRPTFRISAAGPPATSLTRALAPAARACSRSSASRRRASRRAASMSARYLDGTFPPIRASALPDRARDPGGADGGDLVRQGAAGLHRAQRSVLGQEPAGPVTRQAVVRRAASAAATASRPRTTASGLSEMLVIPFPTRNRTMSG